jgi:hypothetical protein
VLAAERVHGDDTPVPVLAKGKTRQGRLWTYVRDDRPFGGPDPPAAVFFYSPDRRGGHPEAHLDGFAGILQADAYGGFNRLYEPDRKPGPVLEAACWAHARRKFFVLAEIGLNARSKLALVAPLAVEAVKRIDAIFDQERLINGAAAADRLALRRATIVPLVGDLETWLRGERGKLSRHAEVARAMDYMLKRWPAFTRFLEDGRICISTDGADKSKSESAHRSCLDPPGWRPCRPGRDHAFVGLLRALDIVHLALPDLLDPVVAPWPGLAELAGGAGPEGDLA